MRESEDEDDDDDNGSGSRCDHLPPKGFRPRSTQQLKYKGALRGFGRGLLGGQEKGTCQGKARVLKQSWGRQKIHVFLTFLQVLGFAMGIRSVASV